MVVGIEETKQKKQIRKSMATIKIECWLQNSINFRTLDSLLEEKVGQVAKCTLSEEIVIDFVKYTTLSNKIRNCNVRNRFNVLPLFLYHTLSAQFLTFLWFLRYFFIIQFRLEKCGTILSWSWYFWLQPHSKINFVYSTFQHQNIIRSTGSIWTIFMKVELKQI